MGSLSFQDASRRREGTHAKGSCESGQAGRSSHKQQAFVQWIILFRRHAAELEDLVPV